MKNKFKWFGHIAGSVLVALVLFFIATAGNYKNRLQPNQVSTTENYSHTLDYVPIDMEYDKNEYYISGFNATASVELSGSNRVLLQRETDEGTRTFRIRANLKSLSSGTHTVKLEAVNLTSGLAAKITPSTVTVQIGKIARQEFSVKGVVKSDQLATGYKVDKVTVNTEKIEVTSDENTIKRVDHIEAIVPDETAIKADFKSKARLQAVDNKGNVLPVSLSTDEATIEVVVKKN